MFVSAYLICNARNNDAIRSLLILMLALPVAVQSNSTWAEDYLGEIIVTGRQPVISGISNTFEVDGEAIKKRNDRSLEEALEIIPNLNVRTGGQGVPSIDIRGLRTRHIKFLVNGIPFNSTFDGQFDPAFIPTSQVDRVNGRRDHMTDAMFGPFAENNFLSLSDVSDV